jgi:N-acetylglucosaminyldiphosphoundecaprenol N-acetyl-beta-D-mannosaminyltransferase
VVDVRDLGKRDVLGVLVDALDYDAAVAKIMAAARERRPFGATALAVHGLMTGVGEGEHAYRLNHLDLVTPDGQPVRWALNVLHGTQLGDTVYGPDLMRALCGAAADEGLPIYVYGSRPQVLARLVRALERQFPGLLIAGCEPSKFRRTTIEEKGQIVERIRASGAAIVFVGLGCPRQEVFVYEYRDALGIPVVAVGAAFDYLAGVVPETRPAVRRLGLQWLHRLVQEPRRLWRRYTIVNAQFLILFGLRAVGVWRPTSAMVPERELLYG